MKSTVPVGTGDRVRERIRHTLAERGLDIELDVVSNPEFLKEGAAVGDFMKPERIVVGTDNPRTAELLRLLYDPFTRSREKLIVMDVRSAELTKYAANAMLATKISFMNELANLAERFGADIEKVRVGIGSDPRIGYHFIYPGLGYGGSCFPKDVQALARSARSAGYEPKLLDSVETVNKSQKQVLFDKISRHYSGNLKSKTIAVWGLAFKPGTDDMREAPAIPIVKALVERGAAVCAFDPVAMSQAEQVLSGIQFADDAYAAADGADVLVIVTEWDEFRALDLERVAASLRGKILVDLRNVYDPGEAEEAGLTYYGVGRGRPRG